MFAGAVLLRAAGTAPGQGWQKQPPACAIPLLQGTDFSLCFRIKTLGCDESHWSVGIHSRVSSAGAAGGWITPADGVVII